MASIRGLVVLGVVVSAVVIFALLGTAIWRTVEEPRPFAIELLSRFDRPAQPGDATLRTFTVRQGESTAEIADRLEVAGLIRQSMVFRLMAELGGVAGGLAAGEYELSAGMKPSDILMTLAEAKTKPPPLVTIPEGWRAEEVGERLAARGVGTADQFVEVVREGTSESTLLAGRPAGASLEGYLFPESYAVDSNTVPLSMAQRMVDQFELQFSPEMRRKAAALGMSVHEVVTLASVIEREAVIPSERPLMAGVFYNRLREGMMLQSDPTVQYALASALPESQRRYGWWKNTLTPEDLQLDSPYNSYVYPGLPPGPICNPGLASLQAAVDPTPTDYLYFVAKPDGSHAFARTLDEHNDNVARYGR